MSEATAPTPAENVEPARTTRKPFSTTVLVVIGLVVAFFVVSAVIKATRGPSTKAEVCASFDKLGQRVSQANGIIDNPVFSQAGDLSDLADRYEGTPDLSGDAKALSRISDSDATNTLELLRATQQIARLCGHPLRVF